METFSGEWDSRRDAEAAVEKVLPKGDVEAGT